MKAQIPEPPPVPWFSPKPPPVQPRKLSHKEFWRAEYEFREFVRSKAARDMERDGHEILMTLARIEPRPSDATIFALETEDADTQRLLDQAWREFDEQRIADLWRIADLYPKTRYNMYRFRHRLNNYEALSTK